MILNGSLPLPLPDPPEEEERNTDPLAVGLLELAQLREPLHPEVNLVMFWFLRMRKQRI